MMGLTVTTLHWAAPGIMGAPKGDLKTFDVGERCPRPVPQNTHSLGLPPHSHVSRGSDD